MTVATCEAVLEPTSEHEVFLRAYGEAFGRAVREVYLRCVVGEEEWFTKGGGAVRDELIARGWLQREATSIHKTARAAQDAAVESTKLALDKAQQDLEAVEEKLKSAPTRRRHGLARRRDRKRALVVKLADRLEKNRVRVCFGSRRLLRATREWEANGFATRQDAHHVWARRRSGMIYVEGDRESLAGNASIRVNLSDERDAVSFRVPGFLRRLTGGRGTVAIPAKGFAAKQGRGGLAAAQERTSRREQWEGDKARAAEWRQRAAAGEQGPAPRPVRATPPADVCQGAVSVRVSWSEEHGRWYAGASYERAAVPARPGWWRAVLGVDVNPDHLAWAVINRDGNPIGHGRIPLELTGTADQTRDHVGCAVKQLFDVWRRWEDQLDGPVAIAHEKLDFIRARKALRYLPARLSRTLSSFAYRRILATISARGEREGATLRAVNPAWTSVLGAANYAATHGLSVDQAAAVIIARRALGLGTRLRPSVQGRLASAKTGTARTPAGDGRVRHGRLLREAKQRLAYQGRHATYRNDGWARRPAAPPPAGEAPHSSAPHPKAHGGKRSTHPDRGRGATGDLLITGGDPRPTAADSCLLQI